MKTKSTPGPWVIDPGTHDRLISAPYNDSRITVAEVVQSDDSFGALVPCECEGNARLIAAAPELLEALQQALSWNQADINGIDDITPDLDMLKARKKALLKAITKAIKG